MSLIGKPIVESLADAYYNGEFIKVSNDDLQGKWAIFYFYPTDFSFVCPAELSDLQKQYAELQELGVEVYSVSTDTYFVHRAWHDDSDIVGTITCAMTGDPAHVLSEGFEVLGEDGLARCGTFIVDSDGTVQAVEINVDGIGRDASTLLGRMRAIQHTRKHPGEICPTKQKEGEGTLKPSLDLVGRI